MDLNAGVRGFTLLCKLDLLTTIPLSLPFTAVDFVDLLINTVKIKHTKNVLFWSTSKFVSKDSLWFVTKFTKKFGNSRAILLKLNLLPKINKSQKIMKS